jgi:tartrate dehydratase alpha subunit/fumarate hydratase class I-like protein
MSNIQPKGEDLRKAVKWISEEHRYNPDRTYRSIIEEACLKFNLSPMDAEYLNKLPEKERISDERNRPLQS